MYNDTLEAGCFNCFIWFMIITFCIVWWGVIIYLITMIIKGISC
jgi:hypothetical protein